MPGLVPVYCGIAFGYNPYDTAPVYTDVSADLLSFSFERGRRTVMDSIDAARATIRLRNSHRKYDPSYTGSPYSGQVEPGVRVVLALGQNLVANPSFETDLSGYVDYTNGGTPTRTRDTTQSYVGTASQKIVLPAGATGGGIGAAYTMTGLTVGQTYTVSAYFKSGNPGELVGIYVGTATNDQVNVASTGSWQRLSVTFVADATSIDFLLRAFAPSMTFWVDAVQFAPGLLQQYVDAPERVYSGFAESWPQDWNGRTNEVTLTALDIFDTFNVDMIPGTVYAIQKSGARITAGLSELGVPSGWYTGVNTGIDDIQAHTAGAEDNWFDHFKAVAATEQGYLFQDRQGNVKFYQRHAMSLSPFTDVQLTLSNDPSSGEWPLTDVDDPDYNVKDIKNDVRVTRDGGATTRVTDSASVTKYRRRTYQITTLHDSTTVPADLATWILQRDKLPKLRPEGVTIEPQQGEDMLRRIIQRDLADRVRLKVQPPGPSGVIDLEAAIQSINMSMGEDRRLVVKWNLAPPTGATQVWKLGTSTLGVDTYLGF